MAYLVPQLVSFIEGMGQALPAHTRALILVSDVFVAYWYVVLAAPFAAFVLLRASCSASPAARTRWTGSSSESGWWVPS